MAEPQSSAHVDPNIFKDLQEKIDQEGKVRDVRQPKSPVALNAKLTRVPGAKRHCPNA